MLAKRGKGEYLIALPKGQERILIIGAISSALSCLLLLCYAYVGLIPHSAATVVMVSEFDRKVGNAKL
jgi:hypothetical protein